jgi:hypothetical protein
MYKVHSNYTDLITEIYNLIVHSYYETDNPDAWSVEILNFIRRIIQTNV